MNANSARRVKVEPDGSGVVAHVGLHALGSFADRLGLGHCLSGAIPVRGERLPLHDRGNVLVQMALVLAGGGESCLDVEHLRAQEDLFGSVPSDSTVWRTFHQLSAETLVGLREALAPVRAQVWQRSSATVGSAPVIVDIDASLVDIHSDNKATTGPTYKGGFGFHPMFCFADATGECLSATLRPGNATANMVTDHLDVLDAAIAQLPEEVARGHRAGDALRDVTRPVLVRTDSAGCTQGFVAGCRERNIGFCVVARTNASLQGAIFDAVGIEECWQPAVTQVGGLRPGAAVIELTAEVDLSAWPQGTRLIVRREPLHPGAQQSLFRATDYRYWGHYTDQAGTPVQLDAQMRAHAHVEDHIQRLKDSGLTRFPFSDIAANRAWLFTVAMAADLVRWFQLLCLDGGLALSRPKALRWSFFHAPGRLVRTGRRLVVRVLGSWPSATDILDAYRRINLIT